MQFGPRPTVLALAEAMFESERLADVVDDVLAFARAASLPSRVTLRLALALLRFAPMLLFVSWRPLERLDRERRRALLVRVEASAIGLALVAWRTLLVLHFYEDARELATVGYRPERRRHLAIVSVPASSGVRLIDDGDVAIEEKGAA